MTPVRQDYSGLEGIYDPSDFDDHLILSRSIDDTLIEFREVPEDFEVIANKKAQQQMTMLASIPS